MNVNRLQLEVERKTKARLKQEFIILAEQAYLLATDFALLDSDGNILPHHQQTDEQVRTILKIIGE